MNYKCLIERFDIEDEQWLQWGEQRAQEVC
jgi:hypothetical protein